MRNHERRLQKIEQQILSLPIARQVVTKAFVVFQKTGELPEDQRVAYAVVKRARMGTRMSDLFASTSDWGTLIQAKLEEPQRPDDEVMDSLLNEAVSAPEPWRSVARQMLKALASSGTDVTTPAFAVEGIKLDLPDYGTMGMHLMGFPDRLAKRPYVKQAKRLFARIGKLRERIPQDDRRWFDRAGDAIQRFQHGGERPDDDLVLDVVLALGELDALMLHAVGEDVAELMAAFDAVARATAEGRAPAVEHLQDLVRAGGMRAPEDHPQHEPDPRSL